MSNADDENVEREFAIRDDTMVDAPTCLWCGNPLTDTTDYCSVACDEADYRDSHDDKE